MKELILLGASGHGKVAADIARRNGYDSIRFLDDDGSLTECGGYPVIGKCCTFGDYHGDFFVAIGNAAIRQKFQEKLTGCGKTIATLIHPNAVIGENVLIGTGTIIMAGAVVNPSSRIGNGCIINTGASVDHDCIVEDYVHISVGAHLAGTVHIGKRTWIGIGAVVSNNLSVTADCMIGAGAVVVKNINTEGIYKGVPAMRKCEIYNRGGNTR